MMEHGTFSGDIVLSDKFYKMPITARYLYFTYGVIARDKGVLIGAVHTALACGCSVEDISTLVNNGYLIPIEDGHYKIVHWYENNGIHETSKIRNTASYREWKKAVLKRDGVCQYCGSSYRLEAHHIKPFADFPEFRFDVDNGIALCRSCHRHLHGTEKKHG